MRTSVCLALAAVAAGGCAPLRPLPRTPTGELPPPVMIERIEPSTGEIRPGDEPRVTLNASDADVRTILPILASAAGVSLVMSPDVRGRVSVRFENVPAREALAAVIAQTGLTIVNPADATVAANVYHQPAVNINVAPAPVIASRFDVSRYIADFIVTTRPSSPFPK